MINGGFTVKKNKENEKRSPVGSGMFLSLKLRRLTAKLRRKASHPEKNTDLSENERKYLEENFPKLEQYMLDDAERLKHMKRIKLKGKIPLYYVMLKKKIDDNSDALDEEKLKLFVSEICENMQSPSLWETEEFPLYLRCGICENICAYFLDEKGRKGDEELKRLFEGLDEATSLSGEECVKLNPTEKILEKDKIYRSFSDFTKKSCRVNLGKMAKKSRTDEKLFALKLQKKGDGFTCELCDKPFGGKLYVILHFALTVTCMLLLCLKSTLLILCAVPVYRSVKLILDRIFCRFAVRSYTESSLELSEIPDGAGVMVTVTVMLFDVDEAERLLKALENMFYNCGEKNVYFSLLCDFPDSDTQENPKDSVIAERVTRGILSLRKNHGDCFYLFLRDRVYSRSEEKYIPFERKRGAVNGLCRFLCGKSDEFSAFSIKPDENVCKNIGYVFTLDSDTSLPLESVRKALGIMLHPNNRPVYDEEKGRVVKGYGILQPKMTTRLGDKRKSFFASVMCGSGGADSYGTAGYNMYTALFGKGVFCGKGMFDKNVFYKALCEKNAFKNETVLSHDAPEGAILRCIATNRVVLSDSFPREQMAYFKRLHRWVRGDVQNIVFFGTERENAGNETIRNNVDFVSKYFMFENLVEATVGIFSLLLIVCSVFATEKGVFAIMLTSAFAPYVIPLVCRVITGLGGTLAHNAGRLFYSKGIYTEITEEMLGVFLCVSSVAHSAFVCADGIIRAVFRLFVSHKKVLEWTTAAQSDKESGDGILGYIKKNIFGSSVGAMLIIFSENVFLKIVGLMFLSLPVTAYFWGKRRKTVKYIPDQKEKILLTDSLCRMWKYFEDNVSEETRWLPPDNVVINSDDDTKTSFMTSPTNIGLYLVSALTVTHAGLISKNEFCEICTRTLDTLEKLPKHSGLFYNWYDVRTGEVLKPKFVSGVDEGNLVACLYVLAQGVKEYKETEKLDVRINEIIKKSDLKKLYNEKKKLFYIGFTADEKDNMEYTRNCYDMLMSETRILSYLAVSHRTVEAEHYRRLSRPIIECGGFMGLASWSGTVFEYFMPFIFMPVPEGSLVYEALKFSLNMNIRNGENYNGNKIFGISESCCGLKNEDGSYFYHAFGVRETALCVSERQNVISPYSSYLMLECGICRVTENLEHLKMLGMYGKYGFYESCDFERCDGDKPYTRVKCYMSHHVGMSICAVGNFLFDGFVRSLFMSDGGNGGAIELLEEKIPTEVYVRKRGRRYYHEPVKLPDRNEKTCGDKEGSEKEKECSAEKEKDNESKKDKDILSCIFTANEREKVYDGKFGTGKFEVRSLNFTCDEIPFSVTEYDAKREPAKIFVFKTEFNGKFSLEAYSENAEETETGAGGAIFKFKDKMGFAFGFCVNENGEISQGVAKDDGENKKIQIYFPVEKVRKTMKEYVFAVGFAKTYDGIHNVRRRVVDSREKILCDAKEFCEENKFCKKKDDVVLNHALCDGTKNGTVKIRFSLCERERKNTALSCYCLMQTKSKLKRPVLVRLSKQIFEIGKNDVFSGIAVCISFCIYCESLDEKELSDFFDREVRAFRTVLKYLTNLSTLKEIVDEYSMLYVCCLERMAKVCEKKGDSAAHDVLERTLKDFLGNKDNGRVNCL